MPLRLSLRVLAFLLLIAGASLIAEPRTQASTASGNQQLIFAGLRASAGRGQFNAVASDEAGNIYALYDQKDGVRLLKIAGDGVALLAEAVLGGPGDVGIAMALSPDGSIYVTGSSNSGTLAATSGAANQIPNAGGSSAFVARFDRALAPVFLSFTGGTRLVPSSIAASNDAVFVAGITYADDLPVTSDAIQRQPAFESVQNGFVEKFSADGSTLAYATYITGALGDTTPTGIAVDVLDDAWLVGSTTASGLPAVAALVPESLSSPSGFLLRLTPAGDGIVFSTFVPGTGLDAITLDSKGEVLLISGGVALGQFPVDNASSTLVDLPYKVLLRITLDGSSVLSGTILGSALSTVVLAAHDGSAWVGGSFAPGSAPLLPSLGLAGLGSGFAHHVTSAGVIDQTIRIGGNPDQDQAFASLMTNVAAVAESPGGRLFIAGSVQPTTSASLASVETFDLPLRGGQTPALPSTLVDARINPSTCSGSLCAGSAAYLSGLSFGPALPSLALSLDDVPFLQLRNLGSLATDQLRLATSTTTLSHDCKPSLAPGEQCTILFPGGQSGALMATQTGAALEVTQIPAYVPLTGSSAIVFHPRELDFGVQVSGNDPGVRTINVSNLGAADTAFIAQLVRPSPAAFSPFSDPTGSCVMTSTPGIFLLAAGATCKLNIQLTASSNSTSDGFVKAAVQIGAEQALLTGYTQAAGLTLSSRVVEFGTELEGGIHIPRYLYLSNHSQSAKQHQAVSLPLTSPFTMLDECPSTLLPFSVCRLRLDYLSPQAPSSDSLTLALDAGLTALLTGTTKPQPTAGGSTVNPALTVAPLIEVWAGEVPVTGVSGSTQTVAISNNGTSDFDLSLMLNGDFLETNSCGKTLIAGSTCGIALRFAPSLPGVRQGVLTVIAGAGSGAISVPLGGVATSIRANNNGTLDLGAAPLGQPNVQFFKVLQPFAQFSVATTGPFRVTLVEDTGFGHGLPSTSSFLQAGSGTCRNCWVGISFEPAAPGPQTGTLSILSNPAGHAYILSLVGQGDPTSGMIASPAKLDFGALPVNSVSSSTDLTLTNLSQSKLPVSLKDLTAGGDFRIGRTGTSSTTCGITLAYTASCTIAVQFAPTATGLRSGSVNTNSGERVLVIPVSGVGTVDTGVAIDPLGLAFTNAGPATQTVVLTNTGSHAVTIQTPESTTASFSSVTDCGTLQPAAQCTIQVTFTPGAAAVTDLLSVAVSQASSATRNSVSTYTIALLGLYPLSAEGLSIAPSNIDFGPSPTDALGSARLFTVTNLSKVDLALNVKVPRNYSLPSTTCGVLPAGRSCSFTVAFAPLTAGNVPGTITVTGTSADGGTVFESLAYAEGFGIGSGKLVILDPLIANGTFDFGQVTAGQTATHVFSLSNQTEPGQPALHIRRISSAAPFLSSTTCSESLAYGQACSVGITYMPSLSPSNASLANLDTGSLLVESDSQTAPDIINLTGRPAEASVVAGAPVLAVLNESEGSLYFESLQVGSKSAPQSLILANAGTVPLHILSAATTPDFSLQNACHTLPVGEHCSILIASTPQTAGTHVASLEITSDATSALDFVSLISEATPAGLAFSPTSLNFGSLPVGSSLTLPLTITNISNVPISLTSSFAPLPFTVSGDCLPQALLAPAATCTTLVTFKPLNPGVSQGSLSLNNSASVYPLLIPITGAGVPILLSATPSILTYGDTLVGVPKALSFTLQNVGTSTISAISSHASGSFSVTRECVPANLLPGQSCAVQVTFEPKLPGPAVSNLLLSSATPGVSLVLPLTGNGIAPPSFTLTVDGGSAAMRTLVTGQDATYPLMLTPDGNFAAEVALTCSPAELTASITCSVLPSLINLQGPAQPSSVRISTIAPKATARQARSQSRSRLALALTAALGLLFTSKSRKRAWLLTRPLRIVAAFTLLISGCGSGVRLPQPTVDYAAPGTYHFTVSASTTNGTQVTRVVKLTLVVAAS